MAMTVTLGKICTFILRCQIFVLTVEWMGKYSRISWNSRKVLREQISRLLFSLLQEKFLHLKRKLMARNSFHGKQSVFPIYFHSHALEKSITKVMMPDQINWISWKVASQYSRWGGDGGPDLKLVPWRQWALLGPLLRRPKLATCGQSLPVWPEQAHSGVM